MKFNLKLCPFCGASDELFIEPHLSIFRVACAGCGCRGPRGVSIDCAINNWNFGFAQSFVCDPQKNSREALTDVKI